MALLIALLTFCVAAPVFWMLWLLFGPETSSALVRRRMEAVQSAERNAEEALAHLQLIRDESLSGVPVLNRLMLRLAWSRQLQDWITQAGMRTRPGQILLFGAVLGLAIYLLIGLVYGSFGIAILLALLAAAAPILVVLHRRQKRLQEFEKRFPEALDLLGRAVRAGHAFTTGIEMVANETAEPVAGEFRTTFEEQNFGLPLRDALLNLAQRVPLVDVRFFVTALLVQKETGGNLAELLDELARVIRERFRIRRDVQVKTAQGRLTAAILIVLPVAMLLIMRIVNPSYVRVLFEDPLGPKLLATAAGLQAVGSLILWKIVHIEV